MSEVFLPEKRRLDGRKWHLARRRPVGSRWSSARRRSAGAAGGGVAGEEGAGQLPPERRRPDSLKWHTAIERRPADRLRQGEGWPVAKGGLWQGEGWLANRDRRRRRAGGG